MAMNRAEKERVNDMRLKIQSLARSLQNLDENDIPDFQQIETCLDDADRNLRLALQAADASASTPELDN